MNRRELSRLQRHRRVRKKIFGTSDRPRLCVFRSLRHIVVQLVDDDAGRTLCAASTLEKAEKEKFEGKKKTEQASAIGTIIAERAQAKGIKKVVFDRGGFRYHGRVKTLADSARKAGLEF